MIPNSSIFSGSLFDRLGRPGTDRGQLFEPAQEADDDLSDRSQARYAVNLSRAPRYDEPDPVTRQLDATMNYSANPRTGRIEKGIYRGKTPAEASLYARREVENRKRNLGDENTGRIGSDRSDYGQPGRNVATYGTPINRTSTGLDSLNQQATAAKASVARWAGGDRRGFSGSRNNGDGTMTTGSYDAQGKFVGQTKDIVPRVRPGETRVVGKDDPTPRAQDDMTHMEYEGTKDGGLRVTGHAIDPAMRPFLKRKTANPA